MKKIFVLFILSCTIAQAQQLKTENVMLITLDGMRWQEVFKGADSLLVDDSGYVGNPQGLVGQYWDTNYEIRRKTLMPFFWSTLVEKGQLYGNREVGSKVNCSNHMWFSYPGYNEILTGFADDERINSNSKIQNPNVTVLEYINQERKFKGKVYAFGSWDVFPFIINQARSGIPVNAGFEKASGSLTDREQLLNKLQEEIRSPWGGVRLDAFTHHYAMECLKKNHPKLLYISYGETDDYAHGGKYDQYLWSATQTDAYIKEIWDFVQSTEQYKDKTTLIITTDHGRGTQPKDKWRSHGTEVEGADQIWIAVMGPDTPPIGVMSTDSQYYQSQVARTVAYLLGVDFQQNKAGELLKEAIK